MRDRAGFAGFRVQFVTDWRDDVAAFLGASYFRAVGGDTRQYGLSARALAVDTAFPRPEEFPRFTAFWFERPAKDSGTLTLYALHGFAEHRRRLRFQITPGGTQIMDIDTRAVSAQAHRAAGHRAAHQHVLLRRERPARRERLAAGDPRLRRPVDVDRRRRVDLAAADQSGAAALQLLFRRQPARLRPAAARPQFRSLPGRRRVLRPPAEPVGRAQAGADGGWGKGAVQLVEIPTVDETFDNIVAFWNPPDKPKPGQELLFGYRLYWGTHMPYSSPLAQTIATRTGIGGTVGQKRQYYSWHFAVDFAGGELGALAKDAAGRGGDHARRAAQTEHVTAHYVEEFNGYRALFDVRPPDDSVEPIDLRLYLRIDGRPLTETWIYQWTPPSLKERKAAIA